MKVSIDNWRWAGVPFYMRTGKRLRHRLTEIAIVFKDPPHSIFEPQEDRRGNVLVIRLQPDEGMTMRVTIKEPGPGGMRLREVPLDMTFADVLSDQVSDTPDAYERLIMDVIRGNQTLFMRGDEVEAAWNWVDPMLQEWSDRKDKPRPYDQGGSGPDDALMLLHKDGRRWREIK
jgi:glucose-6-phosphate 1-dehydrogenase